MRVYNLYLLNNKRRHLLLHIMSNLFSLQQY